MASLPSPMRRRLAIVDDDGNGAKGNDNDDGATGNDKVDDPDYATVLHYWSTSVLTSSIAMLAALCMTRKLSSFDLVLWNFRNLSFYLQ
jgi:hypothetical protein